MIYKLKHKNEGLDDKILEIATKRPVSLELLKFLFPDVDYRKLNLRVQQLRKYRLIRKKATVPVSFYQAITRRGSE